MSVSSFSVERVRWSADGLVPGVVQDADDGTVLMLGWLDAEALDATLRTGEVHFHSRSRQRLWRKGETSGNVLRLREIRLDCDADALLLRADPAGPTCHTGARSCFDARAAANHPETRPPEPQGFDWLETLWSTITERARRRPDGSYTARLLAAGVDGVARKVVEEATEVVLAAKDDVAARPAQRTATRRALESELADLLYHVLVLAYARHVEPRSVLDVLRSRHRR